MNKYSLFCSLAVCAILLSGCSNVRNTLGLEKESPDEFSVLTRAPLEMPEQITLPPPRPGIARPQERATIEQAKEVLLGKSPDNQDNNARTSKSESVLLQNAGASNIDPDIRAKVNKETAELEDRNKDVAEKLLNISGNNKRPSATIVDAKKELERIRQNKKDGKSITDGKTPTIEE